MNDWVPALEYRYIKWEFLTFEDNIWVEQYRHFYN